MINDYEMVIGLEIHVELKTNTKIFCSCSTEFGATPNTHCCPVCMGMPGSLPVLNKKVVEYALKAGLATNCEIARYSKQDRKNYFYPDLPKAYQISQYDLPLCGRGYLDIQVEDETKRIGITRIHIEEDAGKLVHKEGGGTLCDYNRCGVPLIEIVSEPDLRSAQEAILYLQKIRAIMMYIGVSDCKMQEGALRCDVNLSVRKKGIETLGTRSEMKNLNSFQFISKAIEFEYARQVKALDAGETIVQETRRFDQSTGKTFSMRKKEDANDYRYFPDPDLIPIVTSEATLEEIRQSIPELPDHRKKAYITAFKLTPYEAETLVGDKGIADYFEACAKQCKAPKLLANLILSEVFRLLQPDSPQITIKPEHLVKVADLLFEERITATTAKRLVVLLWNENLDPERYIESQNLWQINDETVLIDIITSVLEKNTKSVTDYRNGKTQAIKTLIGQSIQASKGQGNPSIVTKLIEQTLKQ